MTLSAEERAEIARQNGRKSRGPVTDEGKAASRRNAIKHGLRAEVLPLPDDDPEAVLARHEEWADYYGPRGPAAVHLLNECVRATLLADRCDAYHHAALSRRIREAEADWEDERADEVERHRALLVADPAAAVRALRRSGHGCRWLIARWEALGASLEAHGFWQPDERAEAIRLLGEYPEPLRIQPAPLLSAQLGMAEPERARYSARAFAIHFQSLTCQADRPGTELKRLVEPGRTPYSVNDGKPPERMLDPEESLAALRRTVADELDLLRPREARLRVEFDEPDRAESGRRALVPQPGDQSESRLFLRYHAEARTSFLRAFKELSRLIPADAPAPRAAEEDPSGYDRLRERRARMRRFLENNAWRHGDSITLMEAYRAAGLLFPHERDGDDLCPDEPKPRVSSPDGPEVPTGGGLDPSELGTMGARDGTMGARGGAERAPDSDGATGARSALPRAPESTSPTVLRDDPIPGRPEPAAVAISPNEPGPAAVAISPNEPGASTPASPNEPEPTRAISPNEPEAAAPTTDLIAIPGPATREREPGGPIRDAILRVTEEMPGLWDALRLLRDRADAGGQGAA
jgi:hypothetical protein